MPPEGTSEQDLRDLERGGAGDRAAFARLVLRHQASISRLARALTPTEAAAEDVTQETFVAAFRHAASFRGEASVRAWLMTIARNAARRGLRRRAGEPRDHVPLHELGEAAGWGRDPESAAADAEQRESLRAALASLAEEDRAVVVLRDLEGLSGAEAAEVLGIPISAMKTRLHRARLRLMAATREGGADGT